MVPFGGLECALPGSSPACATENPVPLRWVSDSDPGASAQDDRCKMLKWGQALGRRPLSVGCRDCFLGPYNT